MKNLTKVLVLLIASCCVIFTTRVSHAEETSSYRPGGYSSSSTATNCFGGEWEGDASYTVFDNINDHADYYIFKEIVSNSPLSIPPEKVIKGIEVSLVGYHTELSDLEFRVYLSYDGFISWTEGKTTTNTGNVASAQVLGSPSDNWGLWSYSHLNSQKFILKVAVAGTSGNALLDAVYVKVYYDDPVSPMTLIVPGEFIVPAGITYMSAKVWGGGGGGARYYYGLAGGGGGGGGFAGGKFNVAEGDLLKILVGKGGEGSSELQHSITGSSGQPSQVMGNFGSITAYGGAGVLNEEYAFGAGGSGTATISVSNAKVFSGGNGAGLSSGLGGGGGGGAGDNENGSDASGLTGGSGGFNSGGKGGDGSTNINDPGGNGNSYGGGGGGTGGTGYNVFGISGGNGSDGAVILTFSNSATPTLTLGETNPVCYHEKLVGVPFTNASNILCGSDTESPTQFTLDWVSESLPDMAGDFTFHSSNCEVPSATFYIDLDFDNDGVYPPGGTYTGTLTLFNGTCMSLGQTVTITILTSTQQAPEIVITSGDQEICGEGQITVKAIGAVGASYSWYQGVDKISTDQSYTHNFGSPSYSTKTFTFEVTQALPGECQSSPASITVTHSKQPSAGAFSSYYNYLCTGGTKEITFVTYPDPGGTWSSSNPAIVTVDENGLVTAHAEGTASISLTVSGQGVCAGTQQTSTCTFYVYENYAEITGNNGPLCGRGNAVFYISAPEERFIYYKVTTNGITTDKWIFTYIGGDKTITVPDATGDVLLELTKVEIENICTKDLTGAPNSTSTVNVNPVPVTNVSPTIAERSEAGDPVTLTAGGADNYSWSPSDGLNTTTGSVVLASPPKNYTYTVTGTTNGCSSSANATVYVQETCDGTADQYEPNDKLSEAGFIVPIGINLNAMLMNSKDPDWYRIDIREAAKYTLGVAPYSSGSPKAELYNASGRRLRSADRLQPNSYNLTTGTYYMKVSATGFKGYLCYTFTVTNEGPISGAIASSVEDDLKSAGIIQVNEETLTIWPNPARDEFQLYNGYSTSIRVRISDVLGRTMETMENVGTGKTIVFGSAYKPGLYFVETIGENIRQVFKVVKQQKVN